MCLCYCVQWDKPKRPDYTGCPDSRNLLISRVSRFQGFPGSRGVLIPGCPVIWLSSLSMTSEYNIILFFPPPLSRKNERPWQKRWVVFNGSELKYFKNKSDRDNLCLNTVELEKMIDVKRMPDVSFQRSYIVSVEK